MKKRITILSLLLALMLALVACGGDQPDDAIGGADEQAEVSELRVGMVTDEGGVNDQSFNQSAWEGLQEVEKNLGIKVMYQDSEQEAQYPENFETLLDADNDMIWGVGYKLANATMDAAKQNPEITYGIIDYEYEDTPENLVGVVFADNESSFLAGYIAGHMTETDKVGFIGGNEGDVIWRFDYGFQAGVKYAAKELGKDIEVVSQYANSFGDAVKGKSMANNMFQQGADIVMHAAGGVGDGVIEAAKEQDKWAIGVDRDQNYLAPDHVLTSAMKRVDAAIYKAVEDFKDGNFEGGKTIRYNLEDGAVGLAPSTDKNVPQEIMNKVKDVEKLLIDGEIDAPVNEETYKEFLSEL